MKNSIPIVLIALALTSLTSCNKDPEQTGCTDPQSINYDPSALIDDHSCLYNDKEQVIWRNGMRGGWNADFQEGAFRLETCVGDIHEVTVEKDSASVEKTLFFGTAGGYAHKSYFTLLNERDARDFAEGSMRMGIRIIEGSAPEYIRLYIGGKILEEESCNPHRRSDFVEISTHSFNDSLFTPVNIPIRHFDKIMMAHVNVVWGIQFEAGRSSGIEVNEIRWVANKLDDEISD